MRVRSAVQLSLLLRSSRLCLFLLWRPRLATTLSLGPLLPFWTNLYHIYIHVVFARQISRVAVRSETVCQHFIRVRLPFGRLIDNLWFCGLGRARGEYKMPLNGLLN